MRRGRPVPRIVLSPTERLTLEQYARRPTTAQALALRARIVLQCATGATHTAIADDLDVTKQTIGKWRQRFAERRVAGLLDAPRPGAPRKISDAQIERAIATTLESTPHDATHWSTRSLAEREGLSQSAVARMWKAFALQPHRLDTFKLSKDPLFIDKVRDIVGLYLHPPARALGLCVDEKSQIQALDRTAPLLPMRPGLPARRTHDYVRHGTTSLFAALDVKAGTVLGTCHARHRAQEFRQFLDHIDAATPAALDLHLILDNYATHKTPAIHRWLLRHPRVHLHFTPTSASWLNLVEPWFAELSRKQIKRGSHRSTKALRDAIMSYIALGNERPRPFIWSKTADEILESVARFSTRISESRH